MALDPRLALSVTPTNVNQSFANALTNISNLDILKQNQLNAPLQNQLLQQRVDVGASGISAQRETQREQSLVDLSSQIKPMLDSGDATGAMQLLESRIEGLKRNNIPTADSEELLSMVVSNPIQAMDSVNAAVELGRQKGLLGQQLGQSAGTREFNNLLQVAQDPNSTEIEKNAALVALGSKARAGSSSKERILESADLSQKDIDLTGQKSGSSEAAKLSEQLNFKPRITRAVKLEEKKAIDRGDTLSALNRSRAALPGLTEAVGQLRELSKIATHTFGGKLFDAAVKQTGFGATKGATARAKFVAIINNQVLPLLKETFGSAFTFQEGESLKDTMGDPDASPEEKMAQLDAFIAQKQRDIETKELQLGQSQIDQAQQIEPNQGELSPEEQAELQALRSEFGVQ